MKPSDTLLLNIALKIAIKGGAVSWWHSKLRISHCSCCGSGCGCGMGSIPGGERRHAVGMAKKKKIAVHFKKLLWIAVGFFLKGFIYLLRSHFPRVIFQRL